MSATKGFKFYRNNNEMLYKQPFEFYVNQTLSLMVYMDSLTKISLLDQVCPLYKCSTKLKPWKWIFVEAQKRCMNRHGLGSHFSICR